ncbi:iron uptake porin [Calothrix sp. NIES-3974]|uniref:iron uptake porin n=1 Tax=Calothrix sp. NIES-3974 TaxID=2005462 RepID=UPI000BBBD39C|nr:iron uptake porin [Calothrix sp. NIES-3974]
MKRTSLLMAGIITTGQATASGVTNPPVIQPDNPSPPEAEGKEFADAVIPVTVTLPELTQRIKSADAGGESKSQIRHQHLLKSIRSQLKLKSRVDLYQYDLEEVGETTDYIQSGINPTNSQSPIPSQSETNIHNAISHQPDIFDTSREVSTSGTTESPVTSHPVRESAPRPIASEFMETEKREEQIEIPGEMEQVTSVSQLEDILPSDWAFNALQTLVERYGCISGYPDGTFRGNRSMTRYEFAAGVNACWEMINELISQNRENRVQQEDLVVLQRLQEEFTTEIKQLQARVADLEARNAALTANQFSTTTKLIGQAIISVQGTNSPDMSLFPGDERQGKTNTTMTSSTQLTLATSFTGRDLLLTGLTGGNLGSTAPQVFSNMGRLGFESDTGENDIYISELSYRFALADNLGIVVGTAGVNPTNTFRGINPLEGAGDGSISLFGQRNPILAIGGGRSGIGFDWQISDRMSLQGVYTTEIANFPGNSANAGLIGGRYTLGTQVTLAPSDNLDVGIHYLFNHSPDDNLRTGIGDTQLSSPFAPANAFDHHAVGATVAWRVNPNLQLGGWGGWTFSRPVGLSGRVETTNWAIFAALPNLFRPGNLGGVIFGQPPKITASTLPDGYNLPNFAVPDFATGGGQGGREDTSLHLEMFYRAQINNNLSLTPGIFVVFNPNHNRDNDALVVGTLRATFRF